MSANNFTLVRGQEDSLDSFTMDRYTAIVKYKTSFYSFYLPVAMAMNMAGYTDPRYIKLTNYRGVVFSSHCSIVEYDSYYYS